MIGEVELTAFCCVTGVYLVGSQFRPPIGLRTDLSHITTELWEIPVLRAPCKGVMRQACRVSDAWREKEGPVYILFGQWGTRNPIDGDTWFVSFITHRSVQSVFSRTDLKLIRQKQ